MCHPCSPRIRYSEVNNLAYMSTLLQIEFQDTKGGNALIMVILTIDSPWPVLRSLLGVYWDRRSWGFSLIEFQFETVSTLSQG